MELWPGMVSKEGEDDTIYTASRNEASRPCVLVCRVESFAGIERKGRQWAGLWGHASILQRLWKYEKMGVCGCLIFKRFRLVLKIVRGHHCGGVTGEPGQCWLPHRWGREKGRRQKFPLGGLEEQHSGGRNTNVKVSEVSWKDQQPALLKPVKPLAQCLAHSKSSIDVNWSCARVEEC